MSDNTFTIKELSDPIFVARKLFECRSVTPENDGVIERLTAMFKTLGLKTELLPFGPKGEETLNLLAYGSQGLKGTLCFAGHSDVVPAGDGWSVDPFKGEERNGYLFGRGAVDMKGGLACMIASVARQSGKSNPHVSFLITNDEEGPALFGTKKVVEWLLEKKEAPAFFLLGEPSSRKEVGDQIKLGRRGSFNFLVVSQGVQGHVAYPAEARNPLHPLMAFLNKLTDWKLDDGSDYFEKSSFQITNIEVGNKAENVIPAKAVARCNIRFNDMHTAKSLEEELKRKAKDYDDISIQVTGASEAFRTEQSPYVEALINSIKSTTGSAPVSDAGGGTSDARFLRNVAPVAELGLVNGTMHKVDECVKIEDLERLTTIYENFLATF